MDVYCVLLVLVSMWGVSAATITPEDINSSAKQHFVLNNTQGQLNCDFDPHGLVKPELSWYHNNTIKNNNGIVYPGSDRFRASLLVPNFDQDDSGEYTCVVYENGHQVANKTIPLTWFEPIAIWTDTPRVKTDSGHQVVLTCKFPVDQFLANEDIYWVYNNRTNISGALFNTNVNEGMTNFTINTVKMEDEGTYWCVMNRTLGKGTDKPVVDVSKADITLHVGNSTVFFTDSSSTESTAVFQNPTVTGGPSGQFANAAPTMKLFVDVSLLGLVIFFFSLL